MSKDRTSQIGAQRIDEGEEASAPYPAPSSPQRAANPWAAIVDQFGALPPIESKPPRRNPRPPGVLVPGSATDAVLQTLLASPGRFLRAHEILDRCPPHSRVAVSWALLRLQRWGLVETIEDLARHSRYMRYRAKADATNQQSAAPFGGTPAFDPARRFEKLRVQALRDLAKKVPPAHACFLRREILRAREEVARLDRVPS